MRRALMPLLLLAVLVLPAQAADEWKLFQIANRFAVEVPGTPQHQPSYGDPPTESWESDSGEPLHGFSILMTDYPPGTVRDAGEEGMLIAAMKGRVTTLGGELSATKRILNERLPGCQFRVTTPDTVWDFMIRISGDRIYTLSVSSMPEDADDGASNRFFRSFQVP